MPTKAPPAPPGPSLPAPRPDGMRLLSLDGGGVKGVSSVLMLNAIMARVRAIELESGASDSHANRKPVDYFDLAGGTSTGGLIAIMLFRMRMDTEQCLKVYQNLADKIFKVTFLGSPLLGRILGRAALMINAFFTGAEFSGKPLEEAIREVVSEHPLKTQDQWQDYLVHPDSGMMFVCATLKDKGESILVRSYQQPQDAKPVSRLPHKLAGDEDNDNVFNSIKIVEAARATSAAPVYLPEEPWHGMKFWDGGVLNNNPVEQVWQARYDLVEVDQPPPHVACVLSLGCSWSEHVKQPFLLKIFRILNRFSESFMANTEAKHRDFKRLVQRMNDRGQPNVNYWRLNVPTKASHFDMADPKAMEPLEQMTREYLKQVDVVQAVDEIARLLAKKV